MSRGLFDDLPEPEPPKKKEAPKKKAAPAAPAPKQDTLLAPPPKAPQEAPVAPQTADEAFREGQARLKQTVAALLATPAALLKLLEKDTHARPEVQYTRKSEGTPITVLLGTHEALPGLMHKNARLECTRTEIVIYDGLGPGKTIAPLPGWAVDFIAEMDMVLPRDPVDLPVRAGIALELLRKIGARMR